MSKMVTTYILVIALSVLCYSLFPSIQSIASDIAAAFILSLLSCLISNYKRIKLYLLCNILHRDAYIRFSISYLFRIKLNDKYLLVRGNRIKTQFQPVGGVYKRFPSSEGTLSKFEVKDDNFVPIDKDSMDDLRVRVKGKYALAFLDWYNSGVDRELSVYREFFEELIRTSLLNHNNFTHINYKFIRRHNNGLKYSEFSQCKEILIAEIFELMPTDVQVVELTTLFNTQNPDYIWVTEDEIEKRGINSGSDITSKIAITASWLL